MNRYKEYLPLALGAAAIVALDQFTKILLRQKVELYATVPVIDGFFNIVHIQNPGAAFGFMAGVSAGWVKIFFIVLTLIASGVMVYLYKEARHEHPAIRVALTLILGGAVGNLIDRLTVGTVTDFLDFYIGEHHWWAFNVADSGITIGAITAIAVSLLAPKKAE